MRTEIFLVLRVAKQLSVWLLGVHVGTLTQERGRMAFGYAASYPLSALPLSQALPVRAEPFDDACSRAFFAGLLPEGDKRRLIAQALQVSRQNDFGMLGGIGGECAGAVVLLASGIAPPDGSAAAQVRWLDDAQLVQALDEIPKRPMLVGDAGLRLSLAGAQDKLPVVADAARIGLPLHGAPSTHILKPAIAGVDASVLNEGFCMALAAALGLPVAPTRIAAVCGRHYLLVERYDRMRLGAQAHFQRLHQEDFCQALGMPPELKYQNEGGPTMAQSFELVRSATRPSAPHVLALLDYVIFNALIGNHDAHGKNFSLLYTPLGCRLAPLYDALSTAVYPHLSDKMAMKLGSKYKFTEMLERHWDRFATEAGLSPAQTQKRVLHIAARLPKLAQTTQVAFEAQGHGHAVLGQIVALVSKRSALVAARIGAVAA